jgi:lipoprotein NlpI
VCSVRGDEVMIARMTMVMRKIAMASNKPKELHRHRGELEDLLEML